MSNEMSIEEAEKILSQEQRRLQGSKERSDRCEAQMLGEIIGNHRRGRIGDSLFFGKAKEIKNTLANKVS